MNYPDLRFAVETFYQKGNSKIYYNEDLTPSHVAAGTGSTLLYSLLIKVHEKTQNKFFLPYDCEGFTPFHYAASNGHTNICENIIDAMTDKNPGAFDGWTPLHLAAINGHFQICKLIMDTLEDKNPALSKGYTPLHGAAMYGQYEACKLILENIQDKMPKWCRMTPHDLAARGNHHEVCQLFEVLVVEQTLL